MINDKVFKALSDVNRRKIIRLLRKEAMYPSDLAEKLNVSRPTMSEHLKVLKNAGLVETERQGNSILYFFNASVLEELIVYFMEIL
ncbi:MAG: metalloregulator ArsR/SmtB family transcription factor [Candidatus Cloacimonetes bacterium]|nr:metalloregulator ArsR/SmtB family transcription factor [Candidatus Cloacimonadota bacterium]